MNDYIEREDAIAILERLRDKCGNDEMAFALNWAADKVNDIPAADVVEWKKGEWLREDDLVDGEVWSRWKCSECGYVRTRGWGFTEAGSKPKARLCEMCGAEMGRVNDGA